MSASSTLARYAGWAHSWAEWIDCCIDFYDVMCIEKVLCKKEVAAETWENVELTVDPKHTVKCSWQVY